MVSGSVEVKDASASGGRESGGNGPVERWHGWMALCSLPLLGLSVVVFHDGSIVEGFFGVGLVTAFVVAAVFSRMWRRVRPLPLQRKVFVLAVAAIGGAIGFIPVGLTYLGVKVYGAVRNPAK